MLCLKEMHRYHLSVVCGGKRFTVSPRNKKNGGVFTSETSQNTSLILSQSCLRLASAKGDIPAARHSAACPSPPRQMPFAAAPWRLGAPSMCPDCSFLNPLAVMQSVTSILKRGNGCPGTLQGQDKATAEWHFSWKMCFAYNCNRHHLWLLMRTNCLYWYFGICPFCFLGTGCIGHTLLELFFTATVQYSRLLNALLNITRGRKALFLNYSQKLFNGKHNSHMKLYK